MRHLFLYKSFSLTEEIRGNPEIDRDLNKQEQDMVYGIIDLLQRVRDPQNRREIAHHVIGTFQQEGITFDFSEFLRECGLD